MYRHPSLTAAAKRFSPDTRYSKLNSPTSLDSSWQRDCWDMYDLVGEYHFLVNAIASRIGQAEIYVSDVSQLGPNGAVEGAEPDTNEELQSLLKSLSPDDSVKSLIKRLALNLKVTGEGWLVGLPNNNGEFTWSICSIEEITLNTTRGTVSVEVDGTSQQHSLEDLFLVRVWEPHPKHAHEADSPTKAILPVLKELVGLTMHVSAQIDSRLAGAGIFVIPESVKKSMANLFKDRDPNDDAFMEMMMDAMLESIEDRSSPSSLVPITLTVPDDTTAKFQHISFSSPLDSEARALREEGIRRIALGMDTPPEILLGSGSQNHWSSWLTQAETIKNHVSAPLKVICSALTSQFLWPMLEMYGWTPEQARTKVIAYDVNHLIVRPNQSKEALDLHGVGVIDSKTLRKSSGFTEQDAPEPITAEQQTINYVKDLVKTNPTILDTQSPQGLVDKFLPLFDKNSPSPESPKSPDSGGGFEDRRNNSGSTDGSGIPEVGREPDTLIGGP